MNLRDQDLFDQCFTQWLPSIPRGMFGEFYFTAFMGPVSKPTSEAIFQQCHGPVHSLSHSDDEWGEPSSGSENEDDTTAFAVRISVQLCYGPSDTNLYLVYRLQVCGEGGLVKTMVGYPHRNRSRCSLVGLLRDIRQAVRQLQPCRGVVEIPITTTGWTKLMKRFIFP